MDSPHFTPSKFRDLDMYAIKLLIFPLDMDEAAPILHTAAALGIQTIGASSAMTGPGDRPVDQFVRLPFVTDPTFDAALQDVIANHNVTHIFAPHQGVWRHLDACLRAHPDTTHFTLCRPDPLTSTWELFAPHEAWAKTAMASTLSAAIGGREIHPPLNHSNLAALHRQFLGTPGQSDEGKLLALNDIFRVLPAGDVVEVGSLYGRSAIALGYLAHRYRIGNLICVDPWNSADLTDQGSQADLLNTEVKRINLEQVFRIFLSSAAQLDNIGYIRSTSLVGCTIYASARDRGYLDSPELGRLSLAPHLSLLHIDGNHRYDHVKTDVDCWSPFLAPGGWLLLDDYVWAFGDGPRRIGDELLSSPCYDTAFVSGDTLFLRRSNHATAL